MTPKQIILAVIAAVFLMVGIPTAYSSFYTVQEGNTGLVFTWGQLTETSAPGLHFKIPFAQSVKVIETRTLKAEAPAAAATKDIQPIHADIALNWRYGNVEAAYQRCGTDCESRIIDPRVQEGVKAIVAMYRAEDLIKQREKVKTEITVQIKSMLNGTNIIVEDVMIKNLTLSEPFMASIEAKQIAEQNAIKAKNDLERIKVEAQQSIATAQAEAEKIRIQAEAVQKQGGKEYVQLQWIAKWNGALPTTSLGSNTQTLVQLP